MCADSFRDAEGFPCASVCAGSSLDWDCVRKAAAVPECVLETFSRTFLAVPQCVYAGLFLSVSESCVSVGQVSPGLSSVFF